LRMHKTPQCKHARAQIRSNGIGGHGKICEREKLCCELLTIRFYSNKLLMEISETMRDEVSIR
jgi:hypothetical protein